MERLASEHRLEEFKIKMVYGFLKGQNLLDRILDEFPPLHSKISLCKNSYEARLEIMSLLANGEASEHFSSTLKEYMTELEKTVPNLESSTLNILGLEAISDWLMRCPLDF